MIPVVRVGTQRRAWWMYGAKLCNSVCKVYINQSIVTLSGLRRN